MHKDYKIYAINVRKYYTKIINFSLFNLTVVTFFIQHVMSIKIVKFVKNNKKIFGINS